MTAVAGRPCVDSGATPADINSVLGKVQLILDAFTTENDELTLSSSRPSHWRVEHVFEMFGTRVGRRKIGRAHV